MLTPSQNRPPFPPIPPERKPEPPPVKKSRKLGGSLLALSSAAIVTVYSIGYLNTHSSLESLSAAAAVVPADTATTVPAVTATPETQARGRRNQAATPTASAPQTTQGALQDGTYTGSGTSRHGGIQATVVISGGKIVSAAVTSCQTRYPCSDVDSLVKAVVQEQAVPTSNVSGATDSSRAYKQAVSSALSQARTAA